MTTPSSPKPLPARIQRKRTKGWKMPRNTIYVGRGTQWGNPFTIAENGRDTVLWRKHHKRPKNRFPS